MNQEQEKRIRRTAMIIEGCLFVGVFALGVRHGKKHIREANELGYRLVRPEAVNADGIIFLSQWGSKSRLLLNPDNLK